MSQIPAWAQQQLHRLLY